MPGGNIALVFITKSQSVLRFAWVLSGTSCEMHTFPLLNHNLSPHSSVFLPVPPLVQIQFHLPSLLLPEALDNPLSKLLQARHHNSFSTLTHVIALEMDLLDMCML